MPFFYMKKICWIKYSSKRVEECNLITVACKIGYNVLSVFMMKYDSTAINLHLWKITKHNMKEIKLRSFTLNIIQF